MYQFIMQNWDTIMTILAALHTIALAFANLTYYPKDPNSPKGRLYRLVEWMAGIITHKAKQ